MANQSQIDVFNEVKVKIGEQLPEHMRSWDFPTMLEKLRAAIVVHAPKPDKRRLRAFTRHYLHLSGERFKIVRGWINSGAQMTADDVTLVLTTLSKLPAVAVQVPLKSTKKPASHVSDTRVGRGARRQLLDHIITLLNSFTGLATEIKLAPSDAFDSDRSRIASAMQRICESVGIRVTFTEGDVSNHQPMTPQDFADVINKGEEKP